MKKLFFATAAAMLCFFISCNDSATTSTTTSESEKNSARNKEVYRAIETGDVSKLDSFIATDIVDHGDMGDIQGLDSLKKMFVQMSKQMKDLKMESIAEATTPDGNHHFAYFKFSGTCADGSMGMPAGTKIDMTGVDLVRIKDGKAVEHWGFVQGRDMMKMMNMNPAMKPCMDKMMEMQHNMDMNKDNKMSTDTSKSK